MLAKISVIIPLYNKEKHISRAIDSVLAQSFQEFEIIVVDDGSKDLGADIVANYTDTRIRLYRQANAGVSAARNQGIALATCELIAFLDADDAYYPEFLDNIWRLKTDYPAAVAYAMNYDVVASDGKSLTGVSVVKDSLTLLTPDNYFRIAMHGSPVWSSAVAVNKQSILQAGGFPVGVRLGEDIDTWIRLLFLGEIIFSIQPGACYYADATNRAVVRNPPPARYVFFDTIDAWLEKNKINDQSAHDIVEFKNFFVLTHAHHQIKFGDKASGRRALQQCQTKAFSNEKRRLLLLSFLPKSIYHGLAMTKSCLLSKS